MLMLAFESSAKPASVALFQDDALLGISTQITALTHSRTLLPMAEDLLKNAELTMRDIDVFAVAHGPGSFTGIRIGISTVKGLAWASGKPCVGVSTLEAMAWNGSSREGLLCPVMDARRDQVYNALFEVRGGRPERLTEDRPVSLADLAEEIRGTGRTPFLIGDGAALAASFFAEKDLPCSVAPENLLWQSAWGVGKAAQDKAPQDAASLLPVYLRLSQAERERQERLQRRDL